jgi:hypothetical protein
LASAQLKGGVPAAATKAVAKTAGKAAATAIALSPTLELAGQLARLSSALSLARKLFRLGKFAEGFQKVDMTSIPFHSIHCRAHKGSAINWPLS